MHLRHLQLSVNWYYWSMPSIDILIDILIDNQSTLSQHSWTFDQQLVDSQPSVNYLICIDQKLVDSQPTVNWEVDQLLLECQPRCRWSVDQGYQSRVSIEGMDRHSTADAFTTHDPIYIQLNLPKADTIGTRKSVCICERRLIMGSK